MRQAPIRLGEHLLVIEPHEEADFRYVAHYRTLVEVVAFDLPLEHWTLERITLAFRSIGNVCCMDPDCFLGTDFSTVWVLLLVDDVEDVPARLLLQNLGDGFAVVVRLHVIDFWANPDDAPPPTNHVFHNPGPDDQGPPQEPDSNTGGLVRISLAAGGSVSVARRLFRGSAIHGGRSHATCSALGFPCTPPSRSGRSYPLFFLWFPVLSLQVGALLPPRSSSRISQPLCAQPLLLPRPASSSRRSKSLPRAQNHPNYMAYIHVSLS